MYKYSLEQFKTILFNEPHYEMSDAVLSKISEIALEVGSPQYIKTPVFKKEIVKSDNFRNKGSTGKKKNKSNENNDGEWNNIIKSNLSPTYANKKDNVDIIMALLNKLTAANCDASLVKIKEILSTVICSSNETANDMDNVAELNKISNVIFEIVSNNIFYSQMYAKLFTALVNEYAVIKATFEQHFKNFLTLFENIEQADPNEDYDKFCELNKNNQKRNALSTFFVNLMDTSVISRDEIKHILKTLVLNMYAFMQEENRKGEVDELIENIAIMYRTDLVSEDKHDELGGITVAEFIKLVSKSKVVNFKSLSNKTIFKCMDLLEM